MKPATLIMSIVCLIYTIIIIGIFFVISKPNYDLPLTDEQISLRSQYCEHHRMAIELVYDSEWKPYAVKCVKPDFTGDGRLKIKENRND